TAHNCFIRTNTNPNGSGKIRLADIGPQAFATGGTIDAGLSLTVKVGHDLPLVGFVGVQHTIPIATRTILDLNNIYSRAPATPILASDDGSGSVQLYVGALAGQRQIVSAGMVVDPPAGQPETYQISHYHKDTIVNGQPTQEDGIVVSAFGCSQIIK